MIWIVLLILLYHFHWYDNDNLIIHYWKIMRGNLLAPEIQILQEAHSIFTGGFSLHQYERLSLPEMACELTQLTVMDWIILIQFSNTTNGHSVNFLNKVPCVWSCSNDQCLLNSWNLLILLFINNKQHVVGR